MSIRRCLARLTRAADPRCPRCHRRLRFDTIYGSWWKATCAEHGYVKPGVSR